MPNAECRMPNVECRMPNAEGRTMNALGVLQFGPGKLVQTPTWMWDALARNQLQEEILRLPESDWSSVVL